MALMWSDVALQNYLVSAQHFSMLRMEDMSGLKNVPLLSLDTVKWDQITSVVQLASEI